MPWVMKYACFLAFIIFISASCRKDKIDDASGRCKAPVELSRIDMNNFNGQFFHVDSFWLEGKNLYVHTNGSCVSQPKNTALLYEQNFISSYAPDYFLYLTDTVQNDFTMDCITIKPMTLCFDLNSLLPKT